MEFEVSICMLKTHKIQGNFLVFIGKARVCKIITDYKNHFDGNFIRMHLYFMLLNGINKFSSLS